MATVIPPRDFLHALACPCAGRGGLAVADGKVRCVSCGREFTTDNNGVLSLVDSSLLDAAARQERLAAAFMAPPADIDTGGPSGKRVLWKDYYTRNRKETIRRLSDSLGRTGRNHAVFLGAGSGREIEYLLRFRKIETVLCSDLSPEPLRLIPARLAAYEVRVGLFTSDLLRRPVLNRDIPVVFVNVLHHTADMHNVIETYLGGRYKNILLIEPTDNVLIRLLARLHLARRREYSGITPGRLEIPTLRRLCKKHGYCLSIKTRWSFPQDYFQKIFRGASWPLGCFFFLLDALSLATGVIHFGNMSVAHLKKNET
jgi:hypothetical protein